MKGIVTHESSVIHGNGTAQVFPKLIHVIHICGEVNWRFIWCV